MQILSMLTHKPPSGTKNSLVFRDRETWDLMLQSLYSHNRLKIQILT